jgi:flagellar protein FlbD
MIQLTRLNNQPLIVNADLIQFVENKPDTVLTLVTGEKVVIRESSDVVLEKVIAFRKLLLADLNQQAQAASITATQPAVSRGATDVNDLGVTHGQK